MNRFGVAAVLLLVGASQSFAAITFVNTYGASFGTSFGANTAAAQAAIVAAENVFKGQFTDTVTVNILFNGVADNSILGQTNQSVFSITYANLRTAVINDAKSADDATFVGVSGDLPIADPVGGGGAYYYTRAQGRALGLQPASDANSDGTITFGAAFTFSFTGTATAAQLDFQGVAAHEISEIMGRIGLSGIQVAANAYTLIDLASYSGAGARVVGNGPGANFSINNGTTLLKAFNDNSTFSGDTRDWATGTADSFNAFSSNGTNAVSAVDFRVMDVLGWDSAVPEPASVVMVGAGLLAALAFARRRRATKAE